MVRFSMLLGVAQCLALTLALGGHVAGQVAIIDEGEGLNFTALSDVLNTLELEDDIEPLFVEPDALSGLESRKPKYLRNYEIKCHPKGSSAQASVKDFKNAAKQLKSRKNQRCRNPHTLMNYNAYTSAGNSLIVSSRGKNYKAVSNPWCGKVAQMAEDIISRCKSQEKNGRGGGYASLKTRKGGQFVLELIKKDSLPRKYLKWVRGS
ncbi:hypothetical protein LIA77_09083 [Sarocladium implicatum]|nr:hypothetical protein LIA77_09083 [Sarocladium implicatum]